MALGGRHWFIIGCYLSPNDAVTIEFVIAAIFQRPHWAALMVDQDFNADLTSLKGIHRG